MRNSIIILITLFCIVNLAFAQESRDKQEQIDAMKKLQFLSGEWSGEGWIMISSDSKERFIQKESVQFKTDGTTLLIEGKGSDPNDLNKITHDALAIVYYNSREKTYHFDSHVMQGYHGKYQGEVKQDTFIWKIENPYTGLIKYTISLNDKNQWYEIGERKNEKGEMMKFFEMTLNKE